MQRTLDRVPEFDAKSRNFPIRSLVRAEMPRSYSWRCDTWLDQGREGACVGYAWAHEMAARPVVIASSASDALQVYKDAQKVDEWPGENYEGTSVLAGAKILHANGYMDEYRWAFGLKDVVLAIGHQGPGVFGIDWWTGMFDTNSDGFIVPSGQIEGGHAILGRGVRLVWVKGTSMVTRQSDGWFEALDLNASYVLLHNSWGKAWGVEGEAKISLANLGQLLAAQGEFCIPVRRGRGELSAD